MSSEPLTIDLVAPAAPTVDVVIPPPPAVIDLVTMVGLPGPPGPAGPRGISEFVAFDWSTATAPPLTKSEICCDAGYPYTAATRCWFRTLTADGVDVSAFLRLLPVGTAVYVQDTNAASLYAHFRTVADPIDRGNEIELPVVWVANGSSALLHRQAVGVLFVTGGASRGTIVLQEQTAPTPPPANQAQLWLQDNGAGRSQLMIQFATGVPIVMATQA